MSKDLISIPSAIQMAAPGPKGKLVLVDSDGVIQACSVLDMSNPPAPTSVTMLFIDVCTKDSITFDDAVRRVGCDCRKSGIAVFHLVHSTSYGVLSLREEYEKDIAAVYLAHPCSHDDCETR